MALRRKGKAAFNRMIRKANRRRKASGFEKEIHALLREEGIAFVKEKTVGRCHADLLIGEKNLNGCYYQVPLSPRNIFPRARGGPATAPSPVPVQPDRPVAAGNIDLSRLWLARAGPASPPCRSIYMTGSGGING
jgi:hypothetical protein